MVKKIDDMRSKEEAPDHVGWTLWRCFAAWKRRFNAEMRRAGYPAFAEARGALLMHVGPDGIGQAALVARTGFTKQAVQQGLELLEADGLVERIADPDDARRRRVIRTESSRAAFATAATVKRRIEAELAAAMGEDGLSELRDRLAAALASLDERVGDDPAA